MYDNACVCVAYLSKCWCLGAACRKGYREVDEDEQFLPHADNASPTYYRYGGGGDSLSSRPNSTNDDSAA